MKIFEKTGCQVACIVKACHITCLVLGLGEKLEERFKNLLNYSQKFVKIMAEVYKNNKNKA